MAVHFDFESDKVLFAHGDNAGKKVLIDRWASLAGSSHEAQELLTWAGSQISGDEEFGLYVLARIAEQNIMCEKALEFVCDACRRVDGLLLRHRRTFQVLCDDIERLLKRNLTREMQRSLLLRARHAGDDRFRRIVELFYRDDIFVDVADRMAQLCVQRALSSGARAEAIDASLEFLSYHLSSVDAVPGWLERIRHDSDERVRGLIPTVLMRMRRDHGARDVVGIRAIVEELFESGSSALREELLCAIVGFDSLCTPAIGQQLASALLSCSEERRTAFYNEAMSSDGWLQRIAPHGLLARLIPHWPSVHGALRSVLICACAGMDPSGHDVVQDVLASKSSDDIRAFLRAVRCHILGAWIESPVERYSVYMPIVPPLLKLARAGQDLDECNSTLDLIVHQEWWLG